MSGIVLNMIVWKIKFYFFWLENIRIIYRIMIDIINVLCDVFIFLLEFFVSLYCIDVCEE